MRCLAKKILDEIVELIGIDILTRSCRVDDPIPISATINLLVLSDQVLYPAQSLISYQSYNENPYTTPGECSIRPGLDLPTTLNHGV